MGKWAILAILLAWTGSAYAGPFEDATAAHGSQDYATAMRLFRPLADQGSAAAQYNLGIMYDRGQGVPQDYAEAVEWYRKAADQGHARAQYNLGFMYNDGQGVPQDYAEAVEWYRKAADQGYVRAQYNLGVMYNDGTGIPQDYVQAHKWFNLSATKGDAHAVKARDIVAAKMTPAQIAEAQKLAREWKPK
jgi:TPR repeat protein